MNKLFNKLRKNRGLSMFLALAMLISLIPFNTVLANTVSGNDANYGIATVSENGGAVAVATEPTVTGITQVSGVTDVTAEYPGAVAAVRFTPAGGANNTFYVGVQNHDVETYTKAQIEITPYRASMPLAIYNNGGCYGGWWFKALGAAEKQTVEVDLKSGDASAQTNITELQFYLDNAPLDTTQEVDVVIHSIKFINPNAPVEPEEVEIPASKATFTDFSGSGITIDSQSAGGIGTISYSEGATARLFANFTGYTYAAGDVLVVMSDELKTASMEQVLIGYSTSSGNYVDISGTVNGDMVVYTLPEATFTDGTEPTLIRWKGVFPGTSASFNGIYIWDEATYTAYCESLNSSEPTTPAVPSWTGPGGTTVTLDTASTGYTCVVNEDGSVDVTYNAGWNTLNFTVSEFDPAVCSELRIDITPSWAGMNLGITDQTEAVYFLNHWGPNIVEEETRHTITVPMPAEVTTGSVTGLKFYCDPYGNETVTQPTGPQTFTIHSVQIVDPNALPLSKATFTGFSGTEADPSDVRTPINFTTNEAGGIADFTFGQGNTLRLYANYTGYEYNAGDVLVVVSDDIASFEGEVMFCYPTDSTVAYVNAVEGDGMVFYELPEATITTQPSQIRWKGTLAGTSASIKGMYIWDAETYKEFTAEEYDPNQVPQGLAVTYYKDIYSRGVVWNTDNTVPESALYYIKSDGTMTADTVDWTAATKVEGTNPPIETTDYSGKVWHTFKTHVENLEPGATYFYRAGSEEYGWSKVGTFNVEKAKEDIDSLHFIYLTDTQEEQQASFKKFAKLVKDAYTRMPNAAYLSHTGDMVNRGESEDNIHMEEWMYVLDETKDQFMNSVLMPTVGNHDCAPFVFTDRFEIDWADYKADSTDDLKTGGCYSFTYGEPENGVFVISLNTNDGWTDFTPLRTWMEAQLKAHNDYKWKIVQMHAGAMTAGDHAMDGESKALRKDFSPLFAKYKVDLVLQGHDHVYTRTRSMYYGDNPFEEGEQYFDGHTPVYLSAVKETRTVNGEPKEVYIEPQGTHYITVNASGGKTYPEEPAEALDPVIVASEGENPINPKDEDGNFGCITQPGKPMYSLISIEGDLLNYEAYTYDSSAGSVLFDTFAVDKSSDRGYDPENPHEGKTEVQLYGIKVEGKKYDGHPVKLDLSGFNCSEPSIMDTASLKYSITTVSGGVDPVTKEQYVFHPGNLIYGMMPKEPGTYHMTISVPQSNKDFYGEVVFDFTITE